MSDLGPQPDAQLLAGIAPAPAADPTTAETVPVAAPVDGVTPVAAAIDADGDEAAAVPTAAPADATPAPATTGTEAAPATSTVTSDPAGVTVPAPTSAPASVADVPADQAAVSAAAGFPNLTEGDHGTYVIVLADRLAALGYANAVCDGTAGPILTTDLMSLAIAYAAACGYTSPLGRFIDSPTWHLLFPPDTKDA